MQRVTITLDDNLMAELDRMIEEHGYQNRSEAIRDFARAGMQQAAQDAGKNGDCVAALVYVYDHARAICPTASSTISTIITICRWRRCMSISTTTTAWRSPR